MNINCLIDEKFSGVISIVQGGKSIFQGEYGFADKANETPNRIDTRFGTASAGKVFVATAILSLIEQNMISFDTTIGEVLKFDLKQIDPGITIRQLLNHTSGIPDYFDESVMDNYEELWVDTPNYRIRKSSDLIPLFINKPMMYPKGERFQYNSTGYVVLGLIIEELTGKAFDVYLKETIFNTCKMTDTGYFEFDRLPARCANSYIFDSERNEYRTNIYSVDAKGSGAGGAFTSAHDVEKFWTALINEELINKESLEMMFSPQVTQGCYGFGVWLLNGKIPSFQGCDPGANFITSYDLDKQLIVTILSNVDYDVELLHNKIYTALQIAI
ncbi:MAG: serine hydrolase [Clostridiaceae bacterium]|nr:serine hydrolase [Clostridiaceae bacterium]